MWDILGYPKSQVQFYMTEKRTGGQSQFTGVWEADVLIARLPLLLQIKDKSDAVSAIVRAFTQVHY